jgi:hypothetical protein
MAHKVVGVVHVTEAALGPSNNKANSPNVSPAPNVPTKSPLVSPLLNDPFLLFGELAVFKNQKKTNALSKCSL